MLSDPRADSGGGSEGTEQDARKQAEARARDFGILTSALRDKDPRIRRAAARALGMRGPDAGPAVSDLVDALRDPDASVRKAAAVALQEIGPTGLDGVPALLARLRDQQDSPQVHSLAREALTKIGERVGTGVQPSVPDWVPKPHQWMVVPSGADPAAVVAERRQGSLEAALVPPGQYDLYWAQEYEHRGRPLLVARNIAVGDQGVTPVPLNSGLRLEVAPWVPKRDATYGWWGVTRAGETPDKRVHWTKAAEALLLPPGAYDVYWVQEYETSKEPLLLGPGVKVGAGQVATAEANSGLRLEVAPWVPKRDANYGWWGVTRAGETPDKRLHWTKAAEALLLPPGAYDVYWVQEYQTSSKPVLLVPAVKVAPGQVAGVKAASGIRLKVPAGTPAVDSSYGWWGVVPAARGPDDRIHWSRGGFDQPLLVPPGRYDIFWKRNYAHNPERIKEAVMVPDSQLVEVAIP